MQIYVALLTNFNIWAGKNMLHNIKRGDERQYSSPRQRPAHHHADTLSCCTWLVVPSLTGLVAEHEFIRDHPRVCLLRGFLSGAHSVVQNALYLEANMIFT